MSVRYHEEVRLLLFDDSDDVSEGIAAEPSNPEGDLGAQRRRH